MHISGITHPKRRTIGHPNGQVRKDSKQSIRHWRFEGQVMRYLMDSQEQILVRRRTDNVRRQEERPRQDRCITQEVGTGDLERDDAEDDVFGEWFGTA
jgi:hypothetical protein